MKVNIKDINDLPEKFKNRIIGFNILETFNMFGKSVFDISSYNIITIVDFDGHGNFSIRGIYANLNDDRLYKIKQMPDCSKFELIALSDCVIDQNEHRIIKNRFGKNEPHNYIFSSILDTKTPDEIYKIMKINTQINLFKYNIINNWT